MATSRSDGKSRAGGSAGFTLIELLVVISIIALLISILLPALRQARQTAVHLQCLSNVSNVAKAVTMYNADFEGYYPKVWYQVPGWPGGWTHYTEQIARYLNLQGRTSGDTANYMLSIRNAQGASMVLRCPSMFEISGSVSAMKGVYGVNANIMPYINTNLATRVETTQASKFDLRFPNQQIREQDLTQTSNNVMITDSKGTSDQVSNDFNARDWGYAMSPHFSNVQYASWTVHYEYWTPGDTGKGSRGFVDGHAESLGLEGMNGDWALGDRPLGYLSWLSK